MLAPADKLNIIDESILKNTKEKMQHFLFCDQWSWRRFEPSSQQAIYKISTYLSCCWFSARYRHPTFRLSSVFRALAEDSKALFLHSYIPGIKKRIKQALLMSHERCTCVSRELSKYSNG